MGVALFCWPSGLRLEVWVSGLYLYTAATNNDVFSSSPQTGFELTFFCFIFITKLKKISVYKKSHEDLSKCFSAKTRNYPYDICARIFKPCFAKTSPKRSFSGIENERFRLLFAKIGYKFGHWTVLPTLIKNFQSAKKKFLC